MSNPFEKYFQATERQHDKINRMTPNWEVPASSPFVPFDTSLDARYSELNKPYIPDPTLKSAGDLLVDAAASALKIPTIVGGVAVGAADLALSAASKPFEWAMDAGHAVRPDLIPEPMDVGYGYIAKGLHDTIGYDPERAKRAIDDAMFSDARKIQEKEYQSGYTAAEDKAFQDSWTKDYQTQYTDLQQSGATEQQLKDFSTGFDKQYQQAAMERADKYQTSWDKPLSENIDIIGHGFNNLLENPSLALGGAIESAGYLLPSMAVSRGVLALEKAAKVAKLGEGAVGAIQPLHHFAAAGVGEGAVSGLTTLEQMRSQMPDGIAGGRELLGALGVAASTGLIGTGFGKAASKLGVGDIDAVGLGRAASQVAAMKLPALARPVGAVAQEGAEEFAQTFGESIIPNVTMGKDPLEGLGQELPMGTMAGAIMGAGMNAPSLVTGGFSDISSGLGKVKDAASLKSFDTLSNPEHKNYNPAQAFNIQLKNLESNDETVRTQAEASVSKIETDLNTARASVEKRIKSIQATLKAMPPSDQTTDAQKLEIEALGKEYSELTTKSSTLADQYVAFLDAQVTAQEHRDVQQGTQFTEEQAKADIATLTQPQTSTVMTVGDTQIPVQVEGEAKVLADGIEKVIVNYTDAEGNVKKEVVPTSSLASVESTDTTAQQEALNRVTRHFSKYSNDDLDLLATSPVFNEAQRNSLRLMSESKRQLAAVQDPSQVFDNILNGYKGKTIRESHRGLNQYTDMVNTAVATKNEQLATLALDGLGAFTDDHIAKRDAINEAFGLVQNGTYKEIRVVRTEDGTWGFVPFTAQEVRAGKNADGVAFLEGKALKEAMNKVGGFNVHINSNTKGAITQINDETQLIQDRFNALSGIAESFVGVTPKPVDTSTAPTVDAPIVTESSQRSPKLEEAYAEVFAKPIEDWDANDFATIGAQAYYHDGKKHTDKEHDADNAFSQKMAKKIIADGIAKNRSTADIMQDVMFTAYSSDFAMRQSGVDALHAYIELRKAQGTSTTPIVTEPSDTTATVDNPAPEAPAAPNNISSNPKAVGALGRLNKYFNQSVNASAVTKDVLDSWERKNNDNLAVDAISLATHKGAAKDLALLRDSLQQTTSTATPKTVEVVATAPVEEVSPEGIVYDKVYLAKDIITLLPDDKNSKHTKYLREVITKLIAQVPDVTFVLAKNNLDQLSGKELGNFSLPLNQITLRHSTPEMLLNFTHELQHAATVFGVRELELPEHAGIKKTVEELMQVTRKAFRTRLESGSFEGMERVQYALTKLDEFIAVGTTDKEVIKFLKSVKLSPKLSVFSSLIGSLGKLFGMGSAEITAYDAVLSITAKAYTLNAARKIADDKLVADSKAKAIADAKEMTVIKPEKVSKLDSYLFDEGMVAAAEDLANRFNNDPTLTEVKVTRYFDSIQVMDLQDAGLVNAQESMSREQWQAYEAERLKRLEAPTSSQDTPDVTEGDNPAPEAPVQSVASATPATPTETKTPEYTWDRYPNGKPNLEVSSHGNAFSKQFSAFIAKLSDGRTIEEAYQLDVKGYRTQGNDWRLGKGKPPINGKSPEELWIAYKDLWKQFFKENPALFAQMKVEAKGKVLTDKFAKSAVSQARAIAELLNEDTSDPTPTVEAATPPITPTPSQDTPDVTEATGKDNKTEPKVKTSDTTPPVNTKTASDVVKLPADYGKKDIFQAIPLFKKENPDGIIAFRVNNSKPLSTNLEEQNAIGNPFNWKLPSVGAGKATKMFEEWLREGKHTGLAEHPQATEEYRQAILAKLKQNPNAKILYYTELNTDSHANVLERIAKEFSAKEATPPVVSGIKTEGNNTLITSAVSGLTHSVPTKLVNGIFEASYIVKELMAITSKALSPAQREYLEGLLQVFLALDGTILIGLYADLSLIQNDTIRETLQKSKGKAVDYLDEGKRIYIDLNNVEPVDLFEILVHEYHHTVTMQGLKKVEGVGKSSPQYVRLNAAYKAVKAFTDSNPTVDARVLRRLEYMLKNLREFLTVGMVEPTVIEALKGISVSEGKSVYDEISAVNAEILKAQNPKTFPTQQGKLNDLVSTTRGNSSGVQTSSSDSINTPQIESLDTTGNDTKTGNTLRPVATIDGEQTGRGTSEATQSAETSTESQVEPVATENAKVTVLQGVTDAVREEERNKPFSIRNLIRAYFSQSTTDDETKGSNPLVLIKDFILQSDLLTNVSKYLTDKTKSKVTDAHIAQLKHFQEFHSKFSPVVMRMVHSDRAKNPKNNLIQDLLVKANPEDLGTLDENTLTAISLAAYGYLIRFGNTVYNTDKDIKSIVRIKEDQELPTEVAQILRYAGQEAPIIEQQLGEQVSKSLGLKAMKDSSASLQGRLDTALGSLVTAALHDVGYVELDSTSINPKIVGELMRHAGYTGNEDSGTQDETDDTPRHALEDLGTLTFIRPNFEKDPKSQALKLQTPEMIDRKSKETYSLLAPERETATGDFYIKKLVWGDKPTQTSSSDIMTIVELSKTTAGFLSKLMGVDVGFTTPTTIEPESLSGNVKQGTSNTVPKNQQKMVKEGQAKAKFSMRPNTVNVLKTLKGLTEDSKFLKQLLGVWYDDSVKARTHVRDRDSLEAKNNSEWAILERGLDWADTISVGVDEYLDFYDNQYIAQNERQHYKSNLFNMQTSQIHRAMASLAAFKLDISLEDLTLSNENLTRFYQAVGEGLEGLDDVLQASIKKRAGLQQFFTVDKVSADNYVEALQEYLKSDESVKAIAAMETVLRGNKPSTKEQSAIATFVKHGDMGVQSLQSLIALAEMQVAINDGKSSFTTSVGLGSDGVNNGVATANILTGVISREMKQQVGMLPKKAVKGVDDNPVDTMQKMYAKGAPDYYISFGAAMGKALAALRIKKSTTANNTKWHDALQDLFPVYKAIAIASIEMRKVSKTWSIPFNYGAGKKSLQRALGRGFLDGIYKEMTGISNKALEAKANLKSGKITEEGYALITEDLKSKANTLETRINTVLQRSILMTDRFYKPILKDGKNQYMPTYEIKFPTDLTQLNEYTFGNAGVKTGYDFQRKVSIYGSMNKDTTNLIEQSLLDAVTSIHGTAAWEATQEYAKEYTQVRDVLNTSNTAAFMLYDGMRAKLIQAKLNQKEEALLGVIRAWNAQVTANNDELVASLGAIKARKSPQWRTDGISITELRQEHDYLGLTTEEMREVEAVLAPINPVLHSALSQETGDLKSGIALATQKTTFNKAESNHEVETKYPDKYTSRMRPVKRGLKVKQEIASGIKSLAMAVQGIDAYVAAYLQAKFPTLNVHDAGIFGLGYFKEATKYQNEIYLQAMTTYHMNLEHAEALVRSYLGLKDFIASLDSLNLLPAAKEAFIKEATYAIDDVLNGVAERDATGKVKVKWVEMNVLNEETGEMETQQMPIEIRNGIYRGLSQVLGNLLGYELESLESIESALKLWVSLAVSKDLAKLESLKDLQSVHQYSGEGGEFIIGTDGDLKPSEHARRIEEQRVAIGVRRNNLLKQIDRAGTELNLETASSTRQSQLSKLFAANKGKDIDALAVVAVLKSDKSASRSPEQHQRQLQILRAIEPFLKGVKVIYKDMENNEAEGITDRVRGFFEPKTNTIVIRANVIKSDDIALITHEMLHAALSSRITAIENSSNKDSAEYKALKQLKDLRTQLLDNEVLPVNGNEFLALKAKVEKSGGVKAYDNAKEAIKNNKEYQQAVANKQSIKDSLEQANTQLAELNTKFTETQNKLESSKDNSLTLNRVSSERSALKDELRAEQAALQESLVSIAKEQITLRQQVKALHTSIKQANKEIEALIGKDKQIMQDVRTYHEMRNTLKDTVFVVQGGGKLSALKLVEMLEDVHEFISYGLTETTLQDIMQDVFEVPKGNRKPLSLRGAWKMFISAVGRILRMPNTKTLNALTAFSMDVADLLSAIDTVTPAEVSPDANKQFSLSAEDLVNGQSSLDIMQALPHSNTGSFNQQLDRLIVEEIGQLYNQDDAAKARIDELQTFAASDALNAGFTLSRKEQYVQQALQYAVAAYMKLHAGGANVGQLRRVYHAAKVKISPTGKDFHEGDWATATKQEKDAAKAKYDFMFDSSQDSEFMSRFVSMALASESVSKILDIALPLTKPETKNKTWFETVSDWASYVMAWLTNKYVRLNPTLGASNQLSQLMENLVKLDIRARQEGVAFHQKAWNSIGIITTPLNAAWKETRGFLISDRVLANSRFLPLRALGAAITLRSEAAAKAIPKLIIDMRNNELPHTKLGEAALVLMEAASAGSLRDAFDVLTRQANLNAKKRQEIVDNVKKAVNSWFKTELSKAQHKAITYGLLRTDAQALLENYSVEDIVDMALHEGKLNAEIAKLKKEIAKNPNGNDMLNAAEQLGYYMVTRIGGEGLVKNATGIAIGLGTQYFTSVEQADAKLVQQLDMLASMIAMTYVSNSEKGTLAALYKADAEGIHATINLHNGLVTQSIPEFQDNPLNKVKGWMPEITNPYREIKTANSKDEREQMEKEGWKFIGELQRDANDKGDTKYLMKHNDIGYQRYVSGSVDLREPSRSGTEAIDRTNPKYLGITQARYQNAARRAAIPNGSFDPAAQSRGLITAYDTDGVALGYNYEMDNETRDTHLDRNHNIGDLLGTFGGLNYYKPVKKTQSSKVVEVLFDDYKENYSQNPNAYLKLSPKSADPKVVEMWRMLPTDFKQQATALYGKGNPIVIRNEAFNLAFGFKKFSIVSYAFDTKAADRNAFQSGFVRFAKATRGNTAQADFAKAEHVVQEIVKAIKDFIVIRSGTTMMWNIFANVLMLMAQGVNPVTIVKDWVFAVSNVRAYQKLNSQLIQAQADLVAGKEPTALKQKIGALKAELKANPLNEVINAGLLSSIVEDVNIQHGDYTYNSAFKQAVDEKTQWIPKPVKTAAKVLTIAPSTKLYQFLATTTQLSDFVAKYTMSKHLQAGGMSASESLIEASKTFINYDLPTSQGLQYANDMGLFMFTKYFLRIQAVLFKLLGKKAGSVIAQHLLVENLTGAEGILSPLIFKHLLNNPLESSVFGLPSAFFSIGTVDTLTGLGSPF